MPNIKSISYDLKTPGQDYSPLHKAIQQLSHQWCRPLASHWFVATPLTTTQVRDKLRPFIDANDQLLITDAGPGVAWFNLSKEVSDYFRVLFT